MLLGRFFRFATDFLYSKLHLVPDRNDALDLGQSVAQWRKMYLSGQLISTLATGTAPLSVASTTKVTNLNADTVDGIEGHARSHAITGTSDHTSTATAGRILKADASGLPVEATNTDTAVAAAVTASHARSHGITGTPDHTSNAPVERMLKADVNGLPVEAANTDTQVAAAVTASHAAVTLGDAAILAVLDLTGQALTLHSQAANTVIAGPVTGAAADPTPRALAPQDIPPQIGVTTRYIGDDANAKMALGLTINQGAADDEILALKSSDIAHGMTGLAETDTWFNIKKASGAYGAARVEGYGEGTNAIYLQGECTSTDATRSTAAESGMMFALSKKSGTSHDTVGANQNLIVFRDHGSAQFIFDSDGDSHENGTGWTAYDDYDDVALLEAVNASLAILDPIRGDFWDWALANRKMIQSLPGKPLITFNEDGQHFVNRSKMQELLVGAVRQMAGRMARLEATVERLQVAAGG